MSESDQLTSRRRRLPRALAQLQPVYVYHPERAACKGPIARDPGRARRCLALVVSLSRARSIKQASPASVS